MEISHSDIGKKVCETKKGSDSVNDTYGWYATATTAPSSTGATSLCGGKGKATTESKNSPEALKEFVAKTLLGNESKNWPTSSGDGKEDNDNAKAVAGDLTKKLSPEEKTIVAGLLAKTIEGGEIVEIRAVSSALESETSCYHFCHD
ncbi:hypothetical protein ANAPC1_00267 [Anaplasma phagocytophilum]|uniref:Uncharacterized protein n=1 Tax=Anaplasma phagocytophilum TaxID=948 RepID=A0AA45US92_ANAPH|nr:hypothetical protein ANAPC1_00267 [Anaplasma phagocytophilum]SBO33720.1 hypothetical protein ANAPC4_01268 [Anaplasma phagocytophilum]